MPDKSEPPSIDIAALAGNLEPGPGGVWRSRTSTAISYPEDGNLNCLALETDSFWFEHRSRCIESVMRRFPPAGPVFDIGGGNGYVALGLQQAGFQVALVEPGPQGVENAFRRGVAHAIQSTLEDAGFHDDALPAVGAFDVLEHIEDDEDFLRKVFRCLAPGGRLFLTVPAFPCLWSADDDYAGHYRRYTRQSLARVLQKAGFRVEYSTYIFSLLPAPIFLFRALPSRLGRRRQQDWQAYNQEHARRGGLVGWLLKRWFRLELALVGSGKALPFGGSCLVSAIKGRA